MIFWEAPFRAAIWPKLRSYIKADDCVPSIRSCKRIMRGLYAKFASGWCEKCWDRWRVNDRGWSRTLSGKAATFSSVRTVRQRICCPIAFHSHKLFAQTCVYRRGKTAFRPKLVFDKRTIWATQQWLCKQVCNISQRCSNVKQELMRSAEIWYWFSLHNQCENF